jgi:uncharacterized RDD family membrane protein YckC
MIRKPQGDWNRQDEGTAVRTVRTAAAVATEARRGGVTAAALVLYAMAIFVGIMAIASGLATSLPGLTGIGAMAAGVYWVGRRLYAKKLATSDQRIWRN